MTCFFILLDFFFHLFESFLFILSFFTIKVGDKMIHFVHFVFFQNKGGVQNDSFSSFCSFCLFPEYWWGTKWLILFILFILSFFRIKVGDKMIQFVYFVHFVFFQNKGGGQNDSFCSFCSFCLFSEYWLGTKWFILFIFVFFQHEIFLCFIKFIIKF